MSHNRVPVRLERDGRARRRRAPATPACEERAHGEEEEEPSWDGPSDSLLREVPCQPVKLAVPSTGRAACAIPLTAPWELIPPPFRVVLGGVNAPFEPEALAPTPTPLPFVETLADPDTAADPLAELVDLTEPAAQAATPP